MVQDTTIKIVCQAIILKMQDYLKIYTLLYRYSLRVIRELLEKLEQSGQVIIVHSIKFNTIAMSIPEQRAFNYRLAKTIDNLVRQ